jgi:low temperature requirement protein LtrA
VTQSAPFDKASSQRVSWFELFYDLVLVAAISQAGKVFVKEPTWAMTGLIGASILVLFGIWLLTTMSYGLFRRDTAWRRVLLLIQMFGVVVAALSLSKTGLPAWAGFAALAMVVATQTFSYVRFTRVDAPTRVSLRIVVWSTALAAAIFALAAAILSTASADNSALVSILALVAGGGVMLAPIIWRVAPGVLSSIDLHHLDERFGLLVIIVLGESFINLVSNVGTLGSIPNPVAFLLAFLIAYALWAIYFTSVQAYEMPSTIWAFRLWICAHLLFVAAAIAVAVEFTDLSTHAVADLNLTSGNWTPLPMIGALSALALMTWKAKGAPRGMLRAHLFALLLLVVLFIVDLARGYEQMPWFVFAGAVVVMGDAMACAVIRRQISGDTAS